MPYIILNYFLPDSFIYDRSILLTQANINHINIIHTQYLKQIEEIRESIEGMKTKLSALWDCLETSESVRNQFTIYKDYSQTTYDVLYRELERCQLVKRQNIKQFVDKIRQEIIMWWDKTLKSDKERLRFSNYTNDCYTEDLLALHELELEDLKTFYETNKYILYLSLAA